MAIKILIPTPLRPHTNGATTVDVDGTTVKTALDALAVKHPALVERMFDGAQLKRFLNLYLNDEDVRFLDELNTAVKDGDELAIIPAVAGG
jgi:molybdopterin converting factor small subunit